MLAKGAFSVNGKCVLLCTIDEKLGSKIATSDDKDKNVHFETRRKYKNTRIIKNTGRAMQTLHRNCPLYEY
jgi:hypothetical protein